MLEVAIKLMVAAALLGGGLMWLSRHLRSGMSGGTHGVRVTGRAGLTRTSAVAVVQVDGRRFLVGSGDGSVALLTELDEADEEPAEQGGGVRPDLPWPLSDLLDRRAARQIPTAAHGTGARTSRPWTGHLDRLRERTTRRADVERPHHETPADG